MIGYEVSKSIFNTVLSCIALFIAFKLFAIVISFADVCKSVYRKLNKKRHETSNGEQSSSSRNENVVQLTTKGHKRRPIKSRADNLNRREKFPLTNINGF